MARAPPEPSTGLTEAVSGVAQPQPNGPNGRIGRCADALAGGAAERIREVGVVGDVEHFRAELHGQLLVESPALGDREIQIVESAIAEDVAAGVAESANRWRKQEGLSIRDSHSNRQYHCPFLC